MARKNELSKATTTTSAKTVHGIKTVAHTTTGYDARNNLRTVRTVDALTDDKTRVTVHELTLKLLVALDEPTRNDYTAAKTEANSAIIDAIRDNGLEFVVANSAQTGCIASVYIADNEAKLNSVDANKFARAAVAQTAIDPDAAGAYAGIITRAAAPQRAAAVGGLSDNLAAVLAADKRDRAAVLSGLSAREREALAAMLLDC